MSLSEYRRKRDFRRTAEPRGASASSSSQRRPERELRFVVQKHAASRLHYDFRLEWNGVLVSWAVPKGPSLDPQEKRLAVRVEDHPLEYGAFEGAIPKGEYGGGAVLVWDAGTWRPWEDAAEGLRIGKLKFDLFGEKLRGGWMLVRRGGAKAAADERNWFLIKERDADARPAAEFDVLAELPLSVASGRDLDAIARDPGRMWASGRSQPAEAPDAKPVLERRKPKGSLGPRRALPDFVPPQLATLVATPPAGEQWLHEIKLDGYRMLCRIQNGKAQLLSRTGQDWTAKLEPLARSAVELPVRAALLDGEVVALADDGRTNFQDLQNAFREQRVGRLIYYAFDLLHLDGHDLTGKPLLERKELLAQLVPPSGSIRLSDYVVGEGPDYFAQACELQLEGIVSKRLDRPYSSGRGGDWLKAKCLNRQEFVIGGFTPPAGSRRHFGALLVGYFEGRKFLYAGRVGTGFSDRALEDLRKRLDEHVVDDSPFANPELIEAPRGAKWVRPRLVAQLEFTGWTRDGLLRHASFQGLREDKTAREVVREAPRPKAKARAFQPPRAAANANKAAEAKPPTLAVLERAAKEVRELGMRFTSPEKVLYPELNLTKLELAAYYLAVADWILPHLVQRPLSIVRCPDGHHKACFFQKHPGAAVPEALRRIPVTEKNVTEEYLIADDAAGLVGLVQIGGLEIHVWGAQASRLERPDQLIFDLDPDETVPWPEVAAAARELRGFLVDLGLAAFLKTTGGKGLHLVTPLVRRSTWEEAKAFAQGVAMSMARARPQRYVAVASKAQRRGKIYIDYLRNSRGATAIAPYSTRARAGATVSVPIDWEELGPKLQSDHWSVRTLPARLRALRHDPWQDLDDARSAITAKMRRTVEVR